MNRPLEYRAEVLDDIDQAYDWYEGRRVGLGEEFLRELRKELDRIWRTPELAPVQYRGVRSMQLSQFPYAIYYRVESDRITILALTHTSRDPSVWKRRT